MDRHGVRYMFEHRLLPQCFFEDKAQFVGMLLHDKEILYRVISEIFEKESVANPYTVKQFDIDAGKITEEVMMMKISFPEPEEEPLCYCAYLFFDNEFEKTSYFCIEKGNDASQQYPFVCSWSSDGVHHNHGNCTFEKHGDFLRCTDIHMENEYGLTRKTQEDAADE